MSNITPEQKRIVKETFAQLADDTERFAATFYDRLFDVAPDYRSLFKGDLNEQGKKLMQMVTIAVHSLDQLESIIPAVEALGERHVAYGVRDEDYIVVGQALLWTLRKFLGEKYTPEVSMAWAAVYVLLTEVATAKHKIAA
jgi:hemoglobin-like flavoprotein